MAIRKGVFVRSYFAKSGQWLVEMAVGSVVAAIVGVAIWTNYARAIEDANQAGIEFNLVKLQNRLDEYRCDHLGQNAPSLEALTMRTDAAGNPTDDESDGFGPYLQTIPRLVSEGHDPQFGWTYDSDTGTVSVRLISHP
ncbi:MAG: hypothetical protein R3C28_00675 [Pirellulaceae bacterium]